MIPYLHFFWLVVSPYVARTYKLGGPAAGVSPYATTSYVNPNYFLDSDKGLVRLHYGKKCNTIRNREQYNDISQVG